MQILLLVLAGAVPDLGGRRCAPIIAGTGQCVAGLRMGDRRAHALLQALPMFRLHLNGFLNRDLHGLLAGLLGRDTITAGWPRGPSGLGC